MINKGKYYSSTFTVKMQETRQKKGRRAVKMADQQSSFLNKQNRKMVGIQVHCTENCNQ